MKLVGSSKRYGLSILMSIAALSVQAAQAEKIDHPAMMAKVISLRGTIVESEVDSGSARAEESDGRSRVTRVRIPEYRLTDELLARIGTIKSLEILDLTADEFSVGVVPEDIVDWLVTLPNLTEVRAHGSQITDVGVGHLRNLSKLKRLELEGAEIGDRTLAHLKDLPELETLALGQPSLKRVYHHYFRGHRITDSGLTHLGKFRSLRNLSLSSTSITNTGVAMLARSTQLDRLGLGHTQVSDVGVAHLAEMAGLRALNLEATRVTDKGLATVAKLSALRELSLSFTAITDDGAKHLEKLSELHRLELQRTRIGDRTLAALNALTQLRKVDLGFTRITDSGLALFAKSRDLSRLYLDGTQVGDAGVAKLSHMKHLAELDLSHSAVTGAAGPGLASLSGLTRLTLADTDFDDGGMAKLASLSQLRELNLNATRVTDEGLRPLLKLDLRSLSLADTELTDAGLATIGELSGLEFLVMDRTKITGAGFKHLARLLGMRTLHFSETAVDDRAAKTIRRMKRLNIFGATGVRGLTDEGIKEIRNLTDIHTMELAGTSVTDGTVEYLSDFKNMHCYDLAGTGVTAEGISGLAKYANVHSFSLDGKQGTTAGFRNARKGMALYHEIYLVGPEVDDSFMDRAKGFLTGIKEINLFGTSLTDVGLAHLDVVESLVALRIAGSEFSPEAIDRLRRALPNVTIAIAGERGWQLIKPWGDASEVSIMP